MSMDPAEFEQRKAKLIAECQRIAEPYVFDVIPFDRSAVLDQAREMTEQIVGQPCLAQFDGHVIRVSSPVIDRRRIDG